MTNVVAMNYRAVMTQLARWRRVVILVVCIGQRMAALLTRRVCAAWWTSVGLVPPVRQQLLDSAVQLRGQSREHVLQVGPGIVPLSLADCSRLITTAARSPASWLPMNNQFAYFSPSWTPIQADRGRHFSVIVDGILD